jgi:WD40 repeat protein
LAQVWNLTTGESQLSLPFPGIFVLKISFTPDGRQLVTTSTDSLTTFWDANSGERQRSFTSDESAILSPDGSQLFVSAGGGVVRVYLTNVDDLISLAQSRLTRSLTEEECQQYLHVAACPTE